MPETHASKEPIDSADDLGLVRPAAQLDQVGDLLDAKNASTHPRGWVAGVKAWFASQFSHPFGSDNQEPVISIVPKLLPLTSRYDETQHGIYVEAIQEALTGADRVSITNIALSGSYGVGKSSVLDEVARAHRGSAIQISLSTLGSAESGQTVKNGESSVTNSIQKEIVKQLLYRESPEKMAGSRFRRIGKLGRWHSLGIALLAACIVTIIFYLAGWSDKLSHLFDALWHPGAWMPFILLAATTTFIFFGMTLLHGRIQIQSLSTGYATIAVASESKISYFDEYLDEIVYYFEQTKTSIVIFEDIDRFEDPHIFERLRALNTLLNHAKQLDGQNIRFIYAIKDSIFDQLGLLASGKEPAEIANLDSTAAELARANRTKFFDLVIPVVPFITHRNAKDLMKRTLKDIDSTISDDLIELASKHVADMRLILNIRNEFVIFRKKVLQDEGGSLALDKDALLAMMLYKSTHLSDFEKIKLGNSQLDLLYTDYRAVVNQTLRRLHAENASLYKTLRNLDSQKSRSRRLGTALMAYLDRVVAGYPNTQWYQGKNVQFGGTTWDADQSQTFEFWKAFTEDTQDQPIIANFYNRQLGTMIPFTIQHSDVVGIVNESLDMDQWLQTDRKPLETRQRAIKHELTALSHPDMQTIASNEAIHLDSGETFAQCVTTRIPSKLGQELVLQGYLDENFTLYTSNYYTELVSTQAQNFIIHHIRPNVMDPNYQLSSQDVLAVLKDGGPSLLHERAVYNVDILDYLLDTDDDRATTIIEYLASFRTSDEAFLATYFVAGKYATQLSALLVQEANEVLSWIAESPALESVRLEILNAALMNADPEREYIDTPILRSVVAENVANLAIFVDPAVTPQHAQNGAAALSKLGVRLPDLGPLSKTMRSAIISSNCYKITQPNLITALENSTQFALDQLRMSRPDVYQYVLQNLSEYAQSLQTSDPNAESFAGTEEFEETIGEVYQANSKLLGPLLTLAATQCIVRDLDTVPDETWDILLNSRRVVPSFANVRRYVAEREEITPTLGAYLESVEGLQVTAQDSQEDKAGLAVTILNHEQWEGEPDTPVALVSSLDLASPLDSSDIVAEGGRLVGLLVQAQLLADNAQSFALTHAFDWSTREFAISLSHQFADFATTTDLPVAEVALVLDSVLIPDTTKAALMEHIENFLTEDNAQALEAVARYAAAQPIELDTALISRMAEAEVDTHTILKLLAPHIAQLSEESVATILTLLDEPYSDLAVRNGKRPRLEDTQIHRALARRLKELGLATSISYHDDHLRVIMKAS